MTLKFAILCVMIYLIVMWAFMLGDTLTEYKIPWLDKIADKLTSIGIGILLVFVIFFFVIFTYGVVTDGLSFFIWE